MRMTWCGGMPILIGVAMAAGLLAQTTRTTLAHASARGLVTVSVSGTGASSGDSVKVRVARRSKAGPGNLALTVPPGTRLASADAGAQNMVVAGVRGRMTGPSSYHPSSEIVVSGTTPATYLLEAYCADFERDNPSGDTRFSVGRPDPVLACILKRAAPLSVAGIQAAVWIHTDKVTYDHMSEKFPVSAADFRKAQAVVRQCASGTEVR